MSCRPERVTALVDGALGASEAAAVQSHVDRCPGCRSQAAFEQALRRSLRALPQPELPLGLEARLRARLHERRPPGRLSWALLPIAAVLLLGFWGRACAPLVAWELSRDHDACYARTAPPLRVRSGDAQVVTAWFARSGTRLPEIPGRLGAAALLGARYCYMPDVSATPHLFYDSAARPLSLFVVPHHVRMGETFRTGSRGNTVELVRLGEHIVGVVGRNGDDVAAAARRLRERAVVEPHRPVE